MENKAADAVKEIYQKILDTKLEAIDKEKEAIEDLREAREQARKDQENAKEVSRVPYHRRNTTNQAKKLQCQAAPSYPQC